MQMALNLNAVDLKYKAISPLEVKGLSAEQEKIDFNKLHLPQRVC